MLFRKSEHLGKIAIQELDYLPKKQEQATETDGKLDSSDRSQETKDKQTITKQSTPAATEESKEDQEMYRLFKKMYGLDNKKELLKDLEAVYYKHLNQSLRDQLSEKPEAPK